MATSIKPNGSTTRETSLVDLSDARALDQKFGSDAIVGCAAEADDYLRSVVTYDFKWDDIGFFGIKFDHYLTKVPAPGVLTQVTNKVKLQNGFGAYKHVHLYCDYDTQAKKVLGYRIEDPR
jgi:hypothetical protein